MRIELIKGKQKELIMLAKENRTWSGLANYLGIGSGYLSHELKNERRYLSEQCYLRLCNLSNNNFDVFILRKLEDNWGMKEGGKKSKGNTILINIPQKSEKLAEIIGIILGDGNIDIYKKGKKIRTYQVKIAGDLILEREYHTHYVSSLFKDLFGLDGKEIILPKNHERFISFSSKNLVEFFLEIGLRSGDKIKSQVTIPSWVFGNREYLSSCIRGLIDTDGSIHRMSNKDPNLLRINFKNHNKTLLEDVRKGFLELGYHPSKIIRSEIFYISKKDEVSKYIRDIGFSNQKHVQRLKNFLNSPVV